MASEQVRQDLVKDVLWSERKRYQVESRKGSSGNDQQIGKHELLMLLSSFRSSLKRQLFKTRVMMWCDGFRTDVVVKAVTTLAQRTGWIRGSAPVRLGYTCEAGHRRCA